MLVKRPKSHSKEDNLVSQNNTNLKDFSTLVDIMSRLRGENGCPWDLEQTHQSLAKFAIEETYELVEAIENKNDLELKEELGDLLLQVVFHAEIARQEKRFNIADVIGQISEKLIRRHPHVFSDTQVENSEEVVGNWQKIKEEEKKAKGRNIKILNVKDGLAPIEKSQKIGVECEKLGFDWPDVESVLSKVDEELKEFRQSLKTKNLQNQEEELGDILFSVIQLARFIKVDAAKSLRNANRKFLNRFDKMIELSKADEKSWDDLTTEEKEMYWNKSKLMSSK